MNQKNIVLPYAELAAFLRSQLQSAEIAEVPADLTIVGVEIDGERVLFQCRSASWPALRRFGRIPVFYAAPPDSKQPASLKSRYPSYR